MIKFRYTILYVENVEASLGFYGRAFGLETGFLHEGKDYGELVTGETSARSDAVGAGYLLCR